MAFSCRLQPPAYILFEPASPEKRGGRVLRMSGAPAALWTKALSLRKEELACGAVAHTADHQPLVRPDAAAAQVVVGHGNGCCSRNDVNGLGLNGFFCYPREMGVDGVLPVGRSGVCGHIERAVGIECIEGIGLPAPEELRRGGRLGRGEVYGGEQRVDIEGAFAYAVERGGQAQFAQVLRVFQTPGREGFDAFGHGVGGFGLAGGILLEGGQVAGVEHTVEAGEVRISFVHFEGLKGVQARLTVADMADAGGDVESLQPAAVAEGALAYTFQAFGEEYALQTAAVAIGKIGVEAVGGDRLEGGRKVNLRSAVAARGGNPADALGYGDAECGNVRCGLADGCPVYLVGEYNVGENAQRAVGGRETVDGPRTVGVDRHVDPVHGIDKRNAQRGPFAPIALFVRRYRLRGHIELHRPRTMGVDNGGRRDGTAHDVRYRVRSQETEVCLLQRGGQSEQTGRGKRVGPAESVANGRDGVALAGCIIYIGRHGNAELAVERLPGAGVGRNVFVVDDRDYLAGFCRAIVVEIEANAVLLDCRLSGNCHAGAKAKEQCAAFSDGVKSVHRGEWI